MAASHLARPLLPTVLLAATACTASPGSELTESQRAQIGTVVEAQVALFAEGASQRDPQLQASMMAPDVQIVDFSRLTTSREENITWASELFSNFTAFAFTWDEISVQVLGPSFALASAIGSIQRQHVDGRIQEADRTVFFTGLYELTQGEWLLTRGHLSGAIRTVDQS